MIFVIIGYFILGSISGFVQGEPYDWKQTRGWRRPGGAFFHIAAWPLIILFAPGGRRWMNYP